jgi:hypothetical protein
MYTDPYLEYDIAKFETKRLDRKAAEAWRFRHFKSKGSQILTAIVTNVLQLFLR